MTYLSETEKQSNEKNVLIRMKGSISLNDLLVLDSGNIYKIENFDYKPFGESQFLKRNGVAQTRVYTNPTSNYQFYLDEDNKILKIYSSDPINDSNFFTFDFAIYLTNSYDLDLPHNPFNYLTDKKRHWEPRILSFPVFTQSIASIIKPELNTSVTNLTISNHDNFFIKYLGYNISFYEKQIDVYHMINNETGLRYIYSAFIVDISITDQEVDFTLKDIFTKFGRNCYLEDVCKPGENSEYIFRTNIQPSKIDEPIPYVFGYNSYSNLNFVDQNIVSMIPNATFYDLYSDNTISEINRMLPGVCFDYNPAITVTNNRKYVLGVVSGGVEDYTVTPSLIDLSNPYYARCTVTASQLEKIEVGDRFSYLNSPFSDAQAQVVAIDTVNNYVWLNTKLNLSTGKTLTYKKVPTAFISVNQQYDFEVDDGGTTQIVASTAEIYNELIDGVHFTSYLTATGDGDSYVVWIQLNNNAEFAFNSPTFDPETNIKIFAKLKPIRSNQNHADVLKKIIEASGFTTNSSFDDAKLALNVAASFTVPFIGDSIDGYDVYANAIMSSCLTHIYIDENGDFGYRLLNLNYNTIEITEDEIINNSFSIEFDYSQIKGELVLSNEHLDPKRNYDKSYFKGNTNSSIYLNENFDQEDFKHVLDDIQLLANEHLSIRQNRKTYYNFATTTKLFNSNIGDTVRLYRSGLINNLPYIDLKIISIDRTVDFVRIKAIDLNDL